MTSKILADKAIAEFRRRTTDAVFLIIQSDRELMHDYLRAVEKEGLDVVNRRIGREVKTQLNLTNALERQIAPQSTLIQSHQIFED
jgi:hypothetical protein